MATRQHDRWMQRAVEVAATARLRTSPNPWVGCVLVAKDGTVAEGATEPPGGAHAEVQALRLAGADRAVGATVYTTLEPCAHFGRTGPCADALIEAGVSRVVIGILDPDPKVAGSGIARLRAAGIDVVTDVCAEEVSWQLRAYTHHRRTKRPFVVLKLAATLDGRTAAADGSSQWITSPEARTRVHRLRSESDAILVGAGTVRADNPLLTVRHVDGPDPRRIVLGHAPADAAIQPCMEWNGPLPELLDQLGADGVLQLMVEGGAAVASTFHHAGLVNEYVLHLAPALFGGDDARGVFAGGGAGTMADLWRGRIASVAQLGPDLEVILEPSLPSERTTS